VVAIAIVVFLCVALGWVLTRDYPPSSTEYKSKVTKLEKKVAKLKAEHKKVNKEKDEKFLKINLKTRKRVVEEVLGDAIASGAVVSKMPGVKVPRARIHIDNTAGGVKITYLLDVVYTNRRILAKPHKFQVRISKEVYGKLKFPKP
tara:strand:+ start:192 stop:629 length:438 start_codon:yes stop_codon:yes gene_type:complete